MILRILVGLLILCGLGGFALALMATLRTDPAPTVAAAAYIPPPPVLSHVLAAGRTVRAGTLLMIDDLTTRDVPSGQEPAGSFPDTIGDRERLRGAMVRRSLAPNDIVMNPDVLRPGDRGFLAAVLCAGMRAVTVGVDPISGTAGLIWPGDRVDLVLTQAAEEKDQPVDRRVFSETVLTDLRAIAVDQQLVQGGQANAINPNAVTPTNRTVTLEASSYDAERITTAARLGKLSLVVRSAAGDGDSGTNPESPTRTACPVTQAQPAGDVPIAWGGDVSPALRDHPGAKNGAVVRMYFGPKEAEEVKF
jgi:pilus assembly protein CpaB